MNTHICPSILNANFDDLENEILKIADVSDYLHLDIMDNKFVPNFTFDFARAEKIIANSPIPVDSHLMVLEPEIWAPKYAAAGSASVTFHFEATKHINQTIEAIRSNGSKVGLAIKPNTSLEEVVDYLPAIDMLLIMTVEPGFGGQSFMEDQMPKVHRSRQAIAKLAPKEILLQVDGGISDQTIQTAARAGADCFVAGSAVYKSTDPKQMVINLRNLAQHILN
jgi:ribulose-phosphate 3-epimerase